MSDATLSSRASEAAGIGVHPGQPLPLGVHRRHDGFNVALFSRHATRVEILIFETAEAAEPCLVVDLDPLLHRTGDIWHALIDGIGWDHCYAFRVDGPYAPLDGHRFDVTKHLLDPRARALIVGPETAKGAGQGDGWAGRLRCGLAETRFDWQGTARPKRPWSETVIYETHVRGLTIHPSAGSAHPGTFLGVIEKIGYLSELGVTAVELMPVHAFDPAAGTAHDPETGEKRGNYWGYDTIGFFAPHPGYGSRAAPCSEVVEFKTMVRALHQAGLEVILDVVLNHTAEGDEHGPSFNFRGIDNAIYYLLEPGSGRYLNFSGCGNTLNCNHPVVRDYIIDCLRYWVTEMHVDGFRFDLASILGRDETGQLVANPPLLERIAEDPILRDVKLIAEAWDVGGAYQVGSFPGLRWAEWNGRYRDDVRRFWRGDPGLAGALATRLCGSADLYQRSGKEPVNSINFVTCHDGFTLNDLVSYADRHNAANGAGNLDGASENFSANYGVEGPGDDPRIEALRYRQVRNFLATLFLSRGVPMLLGGDEFRRTQHGNNNAWCQDSEISWYDWTLADRHEDLRRFVRLLIAFRRRHPALTAETFYTDADIAWFGPDGAAPDWNGAVFGCMIRPGRYPVAGGGEDGAPPAMETGLVMLFNASSRPLAFALPPLQGRSWRLAIDTEAPAPHDIAAAGEERAIPDHDWHSIGDRALAVLVPG